MKVSVVIPSYKSEKYIHRTIQSVLDQKGIDKDIIVVEDGKFDATGEIVLSFGEKVHLYSFDENHGAQYARNFGLSLVKTEYVMFLDSDDYLEGDILSGLCEVLERSGVSVALGNCRKVYENSSISHVFKPPQNETSNELIIRWLNGNTGPNPSAVLWRTSEIRRIGGWNENFIRNQDGELMIRAMLNGCTLTQGSKGEGIYVQHAGERVSRKRTLTFYANQEMLEEYICSKDPGGIFRIPLNTFRFTTAMKAYSHFYPTIGKLWEKKWSSNHGHMEELPDGGKNWKMRKKLSSCLGMPLGAITYALIYKIRRYRRNEKVP